jgi:hypothetical protein
VLADEHTTECRAATEGYFKGRHDALNERHAELKPLRTDLFRTMLAALTPPFTNSIDDMLSHTPRAELLRIRLAWSYVNAVYPVDVP